MRKIAAAAIAALWFASGVHAADLITGADAGPAQPVKRFAAPGSTSNLSFFPYTSSYTGGVRVGAGDITGDGRADIITGTGVGAAPHVKAFDGNTGAEIRSFFAFNPLFTGGVYVAGGDVNNDALSDILVGAGAGGGPHVKVFSGATNAELFSFFAYSGGFTGGVRVGSGDVNGDGHDDIMTASGPGSAAHVKVFNGSSGAEIRSFLAYDAPFSGGAFVAGGDMNHDGFADIITGADAGGGPHVKVFDGVTGAVIHSFLAYSPGFSGGVRVGAIDANSDGYADIITGAGPGGAPHVKIFDGQTLAEVSSFFAYDPAFTGGVFVAGVVPEPSRALLMLAGGIFLACALRFRRRLTIHSNSARSIASPSLQ